MDQVPQRKRADGLSELTFAMLKPETVRLNLMGKVIESLEERRLKIVAMKLIKITRKQAEKLYEMHRGKPFYRELVNHILSGPVVVMVVKGNNAVKGLRQIVGATDPAKAESGTIRGDYGISTTENIIHAADSLENAEREIKIFLSPDEILS